jgi:hypothetical protein
MTSRRLKKVDDCFYLDDIGQIYFSVSNLLQVNGLPDHPVLRAVVIEELSDMFPEVQILEDEEP